MSFVEIITLRGTICLSEDKLAGLLQSLLDHEAVSSCLIISARPIINVYHQTTFKSDLSLHLHWHFSKNRGGKSELGLRLASCLMNLGLVSHTIWREIVFKSKQEYSNESVMKNITNY